MRKVWLIGFLGLVSVVLVVLLCGRARRDAPTDSSRPVRIGVLLPLSGSMAEYGENGRDGLVLAKEDLARQGKKVELLVQDTGDSPEGTVTAVKRLIDANGVRYIIGGLTSAGVLAAAPYAQERGVLFFTPAASAPGIPEIGDMIFRNWQSDDALAAGFGDKAYDRLGLRRLAILYVSNEYGTTNAEAFAQAFRKRGGEVRLQRAFPQGATDFRDFVTRVRSVDGLDSVLLVAYPDEYRALFGEIRTQGLQAQVLTSDTFFSPAMLTELGPKAEGVVCAVAAKPSADYRPRAEFIAAYRARFGRAPGLVSDTAYDALRLVIGGIGATDGTPAGVSRWLLSVRRYPGVAGETTFTATGDFEGGMALYRVREGSFAEVTL